jgi:hypothetical protein
LLLSSISWWQAVPRWEIVAVPTLSMSHKLPLVVLLHHNGRRIPPPKRFRERYDENDKQATQNDKARFLPIS